MKMTGARLVRFALEQIGVKWTFGIPGVHNTEIYDELSESKLIRPVRVGHEVGAGFMADAVSRTSDSIGTLLIVPAAGVTHAASGIAEAYLDGVPMLVISGGIRNDLPYRYQLHEMDQGKLVQGFTKAYYRIREHGEIIPTIYEAYRVAMSGTPGPVFVEVPVNIQLLMEDVGAPPPFRAPAVETKNIDAAIDNAVAILKRARHPGLFLGWGAHGASDLTQALADRLQAPVATSLQGLSVFPASHPLHAGMGFGPSAVPAATEAFKNCDCLVAVGVRFGEIATGSYGIEHSWRLVHIDINPQVFNANYPADVAIEGDARVVVQALLEKLPAPTADATKRGDGVRTRIRNAKKSYLEEWMRHDSGKRVNPARFFRQLHAALPENAFVVADDGNHTFLAAELMPIEQSHHFISPTDFNCMGYCVPACIGTALANPGQPVVGIVGDGAFLMTCMEILTAAQLGLGVIYFVFHDGELSQISQAQQLPYNRKACTVLPDMQIAGIAQATGAAYLSMPSDNAIASVIDQALIKSRGGQPVIVDVNIDYSKATRFTKGILKTNFERLPLGSKLRMTGRAVMRRVVKPEAEAAPAPEEAPAAEKPKGNVDIV
jgi:acetolactate synthase-1/2/3 large subunit